MGTGKVLAIGSNATTIELQGGVFRKTGHYLDGTVVPIPILM
jgi:hypothetical protein